MRTSAKPRHYLPETTLDAEMKATFEKAVERRRKAEPGLTLAEWVRRACSAQAKRDLAR